MNVMPDQAVPTRVDQADLLGAVLSYPDTATTDGDVLWIVQPGDRRLAAPVDGIDPRPNPSAASVTQRESYP
jgi:hypothetical protein